MEKKMRGKVIRKMRLKLGLTQEDFGKMIGAHRITVLRWETEQYKLEPFEYELLKRLSKLSVKNGYKPFLDWKIKRQNEK